MVEQICVPIVNIILYFLLNIERSAFYTIVYINS